LAYSSVSTTKNWEWDIWHWTAEISSMPTSAALAGQSVTGGPPRGAWAALRRMCQRCMEPHSSFSFWFDDAIVTRSRKMLPSITGRVLEGAMLHEWNTAVESILGGRIAISQLNRETDTQ